MSDFLTNLAARAIAQPSLRPRTRSRFEPASAEEPAPEWPTVASSERRLPAGRSAGIPAGRIDLHEHEEGPAAWKAAERPAGSQRSADAAEPRTEVQIEADIHREIERDVQRVVETNERV
ncbi:MAG TPA: hypothetical protein VGQ36_08840, partial [Thermoanaerobaculia bacterium]|nr:hypothetical protein [Thermoanaerobaculia bacterium]